MFSVGKNRVIGLSDAEERYKWTTRSLSEVIQAKMLHNCQTVFLQFESHQFLEQTTSKCHRSNIS